MNVLLPRSVREACDLLAAHEGVVPVAGGTDLFVHWPHQGTDPNRTFMDLSGLEELRGHRWTEGELILGALTTYWDIIGDPQAVAALPLLVSAARQVGAIQIQTRGTWAGNIVNGSPAADGVAVLMAYDAVVKLDSKESPTSTSATRKCGAYLPSSSPRFGFRGGATTSRCSRKSEPGQPKPSPKSGSPSPDEERLGEW